MVTGASAGVGLGIAHALAARGVHLVLVSRSGPNLARAADQIRARHPGAQVVIMTAAVDLTEAGAAAKVGSCGLGPTLPLPSAPPLSRGRAGGMHWRRRRQWAAGATCYAAGRPTTHSPPSTRAPHRVGRAGARGGGRG